MAESQPRPAFAKLRLDKWLWHARFFKTRGLAARVVETGLVRINGAHALKPAQTIGPGDVLTFPQGRRVRLVRVEAVGWRRGPAAEARSLYTDLDEAAGEDGVVAEPASVGWPEGER